MPVKKHDLSTGSDTIHGSKARDLFLAPLIGGAPTLNGADRLDGGRGRDTIRASLAGESGSPVLKNIETGILTLAGSDAGLDLAGANRMANLELVGTTSLLTTAMDISGAHAVRSVSLRDSGAHDEFSVDGLDSEAHDTLRISLARSASSLGLFTDGGSPFSTVEVTLNTVAAATLWGGAISARNLVIHTTGKNDNALNYDPGMHTGTVRHLKMDGTSSMALYGGTSEIFEHLYSVDLSGMKARTLMDIAGEKLVSYVGGSKADRADIFALGGTDKHPATVSMGRGNDVLSLAEGVFDGSRQRFDGGKGFDYFWMAGSGGDLWKSVVNFEDVSIADAEGSYDLHNLDIELSISSATGAVTLERVKNGTTIHLLGDLTTFLTIEVEGAAASKVETVTMAMNGYMSDYGNSVVGLVAADLSELRILSNDVLHQMYLTTVGSETDGATLRIDGDSELYLFGTNGSTSHIDRIVINNTAGVSLLGLMDGDRAFSPDGVTIVGGAGDDTLWGGIGFDTISTGAGDNIVYGSLGEDTITLGENTGLDQITYGAHNESTFGLGHDTILNFGTFDRIDVFDIGDVAFIGNFADNASGISALSTSQIRAFFNTTTDTLYIDFDHDKALGPNHDMQVVLTGLASFSAGNLFS